MKRLVLCAKPGCRDLRRWPGSYCSPCNSKRARAWKLRNDALKGCTRCGGEKPEGGGRKMCDSCRPAVEQEPDFTPAQHEHVLLSDGSCVVCS